MVCFHCIEAMVIGLWGCLSFGNGFKSHHNNINHRLKLANYQFKIRRESRAASWPREEPCLLQAQGT